MQLEREAADADGVEPATHNLERRLLLGHEQYFLPGGQGVRDEVGDRLRFAGAGRPLEHERLAARGAYDRRHLRAVGGDRQAQGGLVERRLCRACRVGERLARHLDEVAHDGVAEQVTPVLVEVFPDLEGREAQNRKACRLVDAVGQVGLEQLAPDAGEHGPDRQAGVVERGVFELGEVEPLGGLQPLQQAQVGLGDVVSVELHRVGGERQAAGEPHRQQEQRSPRLGAVGLLVHEGAEGEV